MQNYYNNGAYGARGSQIGYPQYMAGAYQPQQFQQFQQQQYGQYQQQQPVQPDERIFVTGRAGADAHQLPPGVNMQILWDNDEDRFYIKGYDNNGRPRVLADNDFQPHVEEEHGRADIDMSAY